MARKTAIDKLDTAIKDILDKYGEDVQDDLDEVTKEVTKKGALAVRQSARDAGLVKTGRYAKGWTSKTEKDRLGVHGTIYNKTKPGLAHLLENGHAKRGGGFVEGKVHIKPVDDRIGEQFTNMVKVKLTGSLD